MKMNFFPERLMGWVRAGAQAYEVRLKHEPNLFQENRYRIYQVAKAIVPASLMFDKDMVIQVQSVRYGHIAYYDGYTLTKRREVLVEVDWSGIFYFYNERGGVRLRLKAIPPNIR